MDVAETVSTSRFQRLTLVSVQDEDSPTDRGKLRTYLGIAPGVGKTYAMLQDARARRRAGVDTVVAQWERHGRPGTAAQLDDLEVLPARTVAARMVEALFTFDSGPVPVMWCAVEVADRARRRTTRGIRTRRPRRPG